MVKVTIKSKTRPAITAAKGVDATKKRKSSDEVDVDVDVDAQGNIKEKTLQQQEEELKRKLYNRQKVKKQKMSKKGFDVVEGLAEVSTEKLEMRRHVGLRGHEDEDLDGIDSDEERAKKRKEKKAAKPVIKKQKEKKGDYLKNEQSNSLALLGLIADKQEAWEQSKITTTVQRVESVDDRKQKNRDAKEHKKKLQRDAMQQVLREAKQKKYELKQNEEESD